MSTWLPLIITALASIIASSGFWGYLGRRDKSKTATVQLLMGLAYNEVTTRGLGYVERGWITTGELGEYEKYFYKPYKALGGNGPAERIWHEVNRLPIQRHEKYDEIFPLPERYVADVTVLTRSGQDTPSQ